MSLPSPSVFRLYGNIFAANGTFTGLSALPIEYSADTITSGTMSNARLPDPITANVNATSLSTGTVANERLPADIYVNTVAVATNFFGNGALITSLDASELSTGTVAMARLPDQVTALFGESGEGGDVAASNVTASSYFFGNGAFLTDLDATNIASGTLSLDRLPDDLAIRGTISAGGPYVGEGTLLANIDAAALTLGTLDLDRLPENVDVRGALTAETVVANAAIEADTITARVAFVGNVDAASLVSGTLSLDRLPDDVDVRGTLTAETVVANAAIEADTITARVAFVGNVDAASLVSGTLSLDRLPANVAVRDTLTAATAIVANVVEVAERLDVPGTVGSNLVPTVGDTYDLGDPEHRWRELHLSGNTIHLGNIILTASEIDSRLKVEDVDLVIPSDLDALGSSQMRLYVSATRGVDDTAVHDGTTNQRPLRTIAKAAEVVASRHPLPPNHPGYCVFIEAGFYEEAQTPIYLPPRTSLIGDSLRNVVIQPTDQRRDVFHVTGFTYLYGLRFKQLRNPAFCVAFPCALVDSAVSGGQILLGDVLFSYAGYAAPPRVYITPPGDLTGRQARAHAVVDPTTTMVSAIVLDDPGAGYTSTDQPFVSIAPPPSKQPFIVASPYIQNCTSLCGPFRRGPNGALVDPTVKLPYSTSLQSQIDPNGGGGGLRIDGLCVSPYSNLRSMVADSFTQVNQGGPGFLILNRGYFQAVSCFTTFSNYSYKALSGGQCNISNSVTDFGDYGLVSSGYWTTPFLVGNVAANIYSTVASVVVTQPGSGYTSAPNVSIVTLPGFEGSGALATATVDLEEGEVSAVAVTNAGSGYDSRPIVRFSGGGLGNVALAISTLSGNVVSNVEVVDPGSEYVTIPQVVIQNAAGDDEGFGAQAVAAISGGLVANVTVVSGGEDYLLPPTISIVGGKAGTVAEARVDLSGVNQVAMTFAQNEELPGTATAFATLDEANAALQSITVTFGGNKYREPPSVVFSGVSGNAVANAILVGDAVASIEIIDGGAGSYTGQTAPTVTLVGGDRIEPAEQRRPDIGSIAYIANNWYSVIGAVASNSATSTYTLTFLPSPPYIDAGSVPLHSPSVLTTGGHVFEYAGSGTTYMALPEYGGIPDQGRQVKQDAPGKVFYTSSDHTGNFRVGELFNVNQATGTVSLVLDNISLGGLNAIGPFKRDGIVVGVQLTEVSNDPELRSSSGRDEATTVPTQSAVISYIGRRRLPSGGTVGQYLRKYGSNDDEYTWLDPDTIMPPGSASAPPFTFIADTDTGTFSPALGQIALTSDGVETVRWRRIPFDPSASDQVWLLCLAAANGPTIVGRIYGYRSSAGARQADVVDVTYVSTDVGSTGFIRTDQCVRPGSSALWSLITCTYNGSSYVALRFQGDQAFSQLFFSGYVSSTGVLVTNVFTSSVTGIAAYSNANTRTTVGAAAVGIGGINAPTEALDVSGSVRASGGFKVGAVTTIDGSGNIPSDARIPALPASKIASGELSADRIPSLDASKITTGTLANARTTATSANTADAIMARNSSGDATLRYLFSSFVNMSHAAGTRSADTIFYSSTDDYVRKTDATGMRASLNVPTRTGVDASGNWPINVTGSAASLTTARAINGVNFNGTAAITVNGLNYNVNDSWLRENGDSATFRMYGNSRQMVFRTDGTTEYAAGIGGYPFVWMYGGDAAANRRMILDASGNLWCSNYGWLHDRFAAAASLWNQRWPAWTEVTSKPTTFAPSAHTHAWTDITSGVPATATRWPSWDEVSSKPTTFAPSAHNHSWANITSGVPATATRWPTWSEVTSKPTTFEPSAHTHPASQITAGTFAAGRYDFTRTGSTGDAICTGWSSDLGLVVRFNASGSCANRTQVWGSTSDERLKTNITDAREYLADLRSVRVRKFAFKDTPNDMFVGVIAQELLPIFPGLVEADEEGILTVKMSIFTPMLITAVQELATKNEHQDALIQSLMDRVSALESS